MQSSNETPEPSPSEGYAGEPPDRSPEAHAEARRFFAALAGMPSLEADPFPEESAAITFPVTIDAEGRVFDERGRRLETGLSPEDVLRGIADLDAGRTVPLEDVFGPSSDEQER